MMALQIVHALEEKKKSRFEFTVKVHGTKIKATLEAMVFLFIHMF